MKFARIAFIQNWVINIGGLYKINNNDATKNFVNLLKKSKKVSK